MRIAFIIVGIIAGSSVPASSQSLFEAVTEPFRSGINALTPRSPIETQSLPPIGQGEPSILYPSPSVEVIPTPTRDRAVSVAEDFMKIAPATDIVLNDDTGTPIFISKTEIYQALADRLIDDSEEIGNNTLFWNQIDPSLPKRRISVIAAEYESDDASVQVLRVVRQGCIETGASEAACSRVNLRKDGRYLGTGDIRFAGPITPDLMVSSGGAAVIGFADIMDVTQTVSIESYVPTPPPAVVIMQPAMVAPAPVPAPSAGRLSASRIFLGRSSYPPADFAAYGILAFTTLPAPDDRDRYIDICDAFFAALISSSDLEVPLNEQMVTVWPIDDRDNPSLTDILNITRAETDSCATAVDNYDILIADQAIRDARFAGKTLNGRGPFLIAWSPGADKGFGEAAVLMADLTDVNSTADAKEVFRVWTDDIEKDTGLWEMGFSLEKLRLKLRQIANRYGDGMLKYFGG